MRPDVLTDTREIEKLKAQVKELEGELKSSSDSSSSTKKTRNSVPVSKDGEFSIASPISSLGSVDEYRPSRMHCEVIRVIDPRTKRAQYYGQSSQFYFANRMNLHLRQALDLPQLEQQIHPNTASKSFAGPTDMAGGFDGLSLSLLPFTPQPNLSKMQEDYFLGLFWQTFHVSIPIVDETEFRQQYELLWTNTPAGEIRKASPLIDIVVAVSMQYGIACIAQRDWNQRIKEDVDINDAAIAGRCFYRRCQSTLILEAEVPCILMLQCQIFSIIYLRNASFINMADQMVAQAVRTAQILGLNHEPLLSMPRVQQELHRRLWWSVFCLESQSCMALGRPWIIQMSQVTCSLAADDQPLAEEFAKHFGCGSEDISWLTYHTQWTRLLLTVRKIHSSFYEYCAAVLNENKSQSLYEDSDALEKCAGFLSRSMADLRKWLEDLPSALKTRRRNGGEPFSTDRSAYGIDTHAPPWLQRQRLLLEALYHTLCINLYRQFICFRPIPSSSTPVADGHAISCVNHAMTITTLIYQMLTENEILNGWHEAFQFQWNATLALLGYSMAYPVCPPTTSARKAISTSIAVLERFGNNYASAASAANITRDLASKVDFIIDRFRQVANLPLPTPGQTPANPDPVPALEKSVQVSAPTYITNLGSLSYGGVSGTPFNLLDSIGAFDPLIFSNFGSETDLWANSDNNFTYADMEPF